MYLIEAQRVSARRKERACIRQVFSNSEPPLAITPFGLAAYAVTLLKSNLSQTSCTCKCYQHIKSNRYPFDGLAFHQKGDRITHSQNGLGEI